MAKALRISVRPVGRVDPADLFRSAVRRREPFFLDSSLRGPELGRYSFVGADPEGWFRSRGRRAAWAAPWSEGTRTGDPLESLGAFLEALPEGRAGEGARPFSVGLAGYLSYDLGRTIERLPDDKPRDLGVPDIHLGLYLRHTVVDHIWGEGFRVAARDVPRFVPPPVPDDLGLPSEPRAIPPLDPDAYVETVVRAKEAIAGGDVFQVNLSQRHALPLEGTPEAAFRRLRSLTPSAFGAYFDLGDHQVLSASPERFLLSRDGSVETRPIKGTRPRGRTPDSDARLAAELLASAKDAAENVMIVDLERNDLGKVCEFGSVHVPRLRALRSLPNVHHLESVVRGTLRKDADVRDLLRATFPGGSITGAPKPRAMEIIEALEPHRRGVYTGALGRLPLDGSIDLSLAIRTATVVRGTAYFAVGGGIVADSDPWGEYRETLDKLRGHAEALTSDRMEVTPHGVRVA